MDNTKPSTSNNQNVLRQNTHLLENVKKYNNAKCTKVEYRKI